MRHKDVAYGTWQPTFKFALHRENNRIERSFRQLSLIGVFEKIAGLIVGKPEVYKSQDAPFSYDELLMEVVGPRPYPIVSNVDCGHTIPMITIPQLTPVRLSTQANHPVEFTFLDGAIS